MRVSIVICSIGREKLLARCLESIKSGSFQDYEIILCQEEGRLVELKDKGWRKAKGEIIVFIDDDTTFDNKWLENIVTIFDTRKDIIGVTGLTLVSSELRKNRDIFKGGLFKLFYNWFFLENRQYQPGQITSCGANTLGANFLTVSSQHYWEVDFLEPSQFAIRKEILEKVNGFDLGFEGVGEWCDVDLCYRIKSWGKLIFHPAILSYHYPGIDSTTNKRFETASRYRNYCRWSDRYIRKTIKHQIYRLFLRSYFTLKGWRLV